MSKNTILRLTTRLYPDPNAGGPAKYAFDLSYHVNNPNFYLINLASNPYQNKANNQKISPNFEIQRLAVKGLDMYSNSKWKQIWFTIKFSIYSLINILQIHRKRHISLIHADTPAITGLICLFFRLLFKIPYVYTYHGVDFKFQLEIFLYKIINSKASKIIIVSRRIQDYFSYLGWNFEKKTVYIPLGIQIPKIPNHYSTLEQKLALLSELNLDSMINIQDNIIIYVGRMIFEQKVQGMIDFLHAFENFLLEHSKNEFGNYKLLFIGDGKFRYKLDEAYHKSPIKSNVLLLGFQSNLKNYYALADLSVLVSYVEGFPTVILESLVAGVPCLCSSAGEMKEMVGNAGFIVNPGDIDEMVRYLHYFFSTKGKRRILAMYAFNQVRNQFDWNSIALKYRKLYLESIYHEKI